MPKRCSVSVPGSTWTSAALLCLLLFLGGARTVAAQSEVTEYYGLDAVGSVRIVFAEDGTVIGRADYAPFGEATATTSGQLPAIQFTGQERDPEAAQDYFGARYYQPRHGRFGTVDPVWGNLFDPQGLNRYAYARGSPLVFVDPTGMNAFGGTAFCPAEYSFAQCGGNDLFWETPGGGGGGAGFAFGGDYARALEQGYVPGMPWDLWRGVQEFAQRSAHSQNAAAAQALARSGQMSAAQAIMAADGTLEAFFSPNIAAPSGASYRDTVDAALTAYGLSDKIDWAGTEWTGTGYKVAFLRAVDMPAFLQGNPNFAQGGLGLLHAGDTGWPSQDYRSYTHAGASVSLQVTIGPAGAWADVDLANPYQSVASFVGHALEVARLWRMR